MSIRLVGSGKLMVLGVALAAALALPLGAAARGWGGHGHPGSYVAVTPALITATVATAWFALSRGSLGRWALDRRSHRRWRDDRADQRRDAPGAGVLGLAGGLQPTGRGV